LLRKKNKIQGSPKKEKIHFLFQSSFFLASFFFKSMDDTLLPITFRPIVLFSIGLWGWALDLCILANCNIDSHSILQIQQDEKHSPLYTPIFYFSGILSIITGAWLFIYYYSYTPSTALVPYVLALGLLFWPGESLYKKDRIRFIR
jgi:hypothetical protein